MVGLLGGRARRAARPEPIASRLLPGILDEEKLEALGTLNILDFGRANSASLELFNRYSCRLCVLDAADTLLEWSESIVTREELPSLQQMQLELERLLEGMGDYRYDLVFLWDTLNHLHAHALPAFAGILRRHVTTGFRGHGFMLHKRGTEQELRHLGLANEGLIKVLDQSPAKLHMHTRKAVNESLGAELQINHGVLHGDGRLEFLMGSSGRTSG
ncbi:MAG: hypothetical protein ACI87W_000301 [Halieaceae bacterium]